MYVQSHGIPSDTYVTVKFEISNTLSEEYHGIPAILYLVYLLEYQEYQQRGIPVFEFTAGMISLWHGSQPRANISHCRAKGTVTVTTERQRNKQVPRPPL